MSRGLANELLVTWAVLVTLDLCSAQDPVSSHHNQFSLMNTCSVVGCASLKYPTSLLLIEISLYSTAGKWKRGSISIYLSSIVTDEDKTRYVSFYLLLANSMTAFNNQQYRRFPSIFEVEYGVGNRPLTGSVGIRNQGLIIGYVRRLDLLLLVWKRTISETTASQSGTTVD